MGAICKICSSQTFWQKGELYCQTCEWSSLEELDFSLVPNICESRYGYIWKTDFEIHELLTAFAKVHRRFIPV